MFPELEKYKVKGVFTFDATKKLSEVCNASKDKSGIYLIYAFRQKKSELIYIGISGRKGIDGAIIHRKDGLRGRFLTGKQFGDRRSLTWPLKMREDGINVLHIHWYVTYDDLVYWDFPRDLEKKLIEKFYSLNGRLPEWNKEF